MALIDAVGADDAELTCRSLKETCLSDGVVAFQSIVNDFTSHSAHLKMNVFQRLDDGSKLWEDALGVSYDDWLSPDELESLKVLYQKRHFTRSSRGHVDEKIRTAFRRYKLPKPGQRGIVVSKNDIEPFLDLLEKLGRGPGEM